MALDFTSFDGSSLTELEFYNNFTISFDLRKNEVIRPVAVIRVDTAQENILNMQEDLKQGLEKGQFSANKLHHIRYANCMNVELRRLGFLVTLAKRRLNFYGRIARMNNNRLTKRILNLAISMKVKNNWLLEIERDLQEIGITGYIIQDRCRFETLVNSHKFANKQNIRTNNTWTDEPRFNPGELESPDFNMCRFARSRHFRYFYAMFQEANWLSQRRGAELGSYIPSCITHCLTCLVVDRSTSQRKSVVVALGRPFDSIHSHAIKPLGYGIRFMNGRIVIAATGRKMWMVRGAGPRWLSEYTARLPPRRTGFSTRSGQSEFSHVGIVPDDAALQGFSRGNPRFPTLRCCSILTSFHLFRLSRPRGYEPYKSLNSTRRQRERTRWLRTPLLLAEAGSASGLLLLLLACVTCPAGMACRNILLVQVHHLPRSQKIAPRVIYWRRGLCCALPRARMVFPRGLQSFNDQLPFKCQVAARRVYWRRGLYRALPPAMLLTSRLSEGVLLLGDAKYGLPLCWLRGLYCASPSTWLITSVLSAEAYGLAVTHHSSRAVLTARLVLRPGALRGRPHLAGPQRRHAGLTWGGLCVARQRPLGDRPQLRVLRLLVSPQVHLTLERPPAQVTSKRLEARVLPAVRDQVRRLAKRLAANLALVRFLPCNKQRYKYRIRCKLHMGKGLGEDSAMDIVRDSSQHSPGVISENHGKPKSGWPDRESNPYPPECESSELPLRHLTR
ncbi:hypothetical protein PR048_004632 [Dryococelus australis]|uniref:Uncharacterized protein n=1 Tax=Dryococelus australis TaxID=614101 RepID=A0ABQ9I7V9_9NEOP|nr:hypothetical protein PR048_004632 [Dryococelus australis]